MAFSEDDEAYQSLARSTWRKETAGAVEHASLSAVAFAITSAVERLSDS